MLGIDRMDWLTNSPNSNPIEYNWNANRITSRILPSHSVVLIQIASIKDIYQEFNDVNT